MPLLGISLLLLVHLIEGHRQIWSIKCQLGIMVVLTALLLTKNSNTSFLPPYFLVIAFSGLDKRFNRLVIATILTASPIIFWWLIRNYLGMSGSHPVVFTGNYPLLEYIYQLVQGLSYLLGPNIFGLMLLLITSSMIGISIAIERNKRQYLAKILTFVPLFVVIGSAFILLILFNLIWINDKSSNSSLSVNKIYLSAAYFVKISQKS